MNTVALRGGSMPAVGTQQGGWTWDGTRWVCCDGDGGFPVFPPGPPPWYPPPQGQPPWYPGANGGVSFGTTAPPNPIRGAFWWDGETLWMFDGAAWVATGGVSGGGTPPSVNPPTNPSPGQQWFNGTTLYVWDGNAWVPVSQTKTSIQATAPPSPNPGDLWYNGTQLYIWSGTSWALVGPGATVGPTPTTQIVFELTQPNNLTVAGGANWTIMPYTSTPLVDTQTAWDPVQHKITPKVPGFYYVSARSGASSGTGGIAILKNDPGTFGSIPSTSDIVLCNGTSVSGGWLTCSTIANFNGTTDYWRVWGWDQSGTMTAIGSSPAVGGILMP